MTSLEEQFIKTVRISRPSQEWRRLFSELLGTFFLVLVAAGGGMMGQAFPDTISRTAAVTAPWGRAGRPPPAGVAPAACAAPSSPPVAGPAAGRSPARACGDAFG